MTSTAGMPGRQGPASGSAAGAVDDAARVTTRRERTAAMLQRSGAFLILAVVTIIASLVFGTRFARHSLSLRLARELSLDDFEHRLDSRLGGGELFRIA